MSKNENDSVQTDHANGHGRNSSSHRRNLLRTKASVIGLWRDIKTILRYPVLIAAFAVDAVIVLPTSVIIGGFAYGFFGSIIAVIITQIPIEILVYQKIKEEARAAKLMSEGWESKKTTEELMKEYKKLLEKKK